MVHQICWSYLQLLQKKRFPSIEMFPFLKENKQLQQQAPRLMVSPEAEGFMEKSLVGTTRSLQSAQGRAAGLSARGQPQRVGCLVLQSAGGSPCSGPGPMGSSLQLLFVFLPSRKPIYLPPLHISAPSFVFPFS